VKIERERLVCEIQGLHGATAGGGAGWGRNMIIPYTILIGEDEEAFDATSPLSKELQLHPWPQGYKPRIPVFNGKTNPRKFITGYETVVASVGGDAQTLAKSLIMALEDITHDWYTSLKPLSIRSWSQSKWNSYPLSRDITQEQKPQGTC
jgi:hypothetical protein